MAIFDLATMLMPQGTYNSSQSFPAILAYPRQLPTSVVVISLQSPPSASATFVIEEAATSGGTYREIARLVWPSGLTGSRAVDLGVSARSAWRQDNTAQWLRLSLTTTTSLSGSAWLGKPTDRVGLGADVGDILSGAAAL